MRASTANTTVIALVVVCAILLLVIIILAAVYGTRDTNRIIYVKEQKSDAGGGGDSGGGGDNTQSAVRLAKAPASSAGACADMANEEDVMRMLDDASQPTLAMVYADWCGFCKKMAPVMDAIAKDNPTLVRVVKINADKIASLKKDRPRLEVRTK
jgi:thiol-disulfide isomerase/thioredoxin